MNIEKLKIFKLLFFIVQGKEEYNQAKYMKQLVELPEFEQIVIKQVTENDNAILKRILGGEWEEIIKIRNMVKYTKSTTTFQSEISTHFEKKIAQK